jgi:D-lyxose ketol-isomerase
MGLVLFTLRNGRRGTDRYPKTYAEKIMLVGEGQLTLTHFHWEKTEDIINRGGGRLSLCLHNATDRDRQADTPVTVSMDGVRRSLPAGAVVTLEPGESITLPPRLYHSFWGERGTGAVLVGEVSTVNDDHRDNCFLEEQLRFPMIDEDEPPRRYLVGDYDMILEGMHGS